MNKQWVRMNWKEKLSYVKICLGRGQSWTNDLKNIAMFMTFFKIWGLDTTLGIILGTIVFLGFIVLGYLDLHHGIWKVENEMNTRETNPYFKGLESAVEKITETNRGGKK
jgi:hypothetical protein